MIQGDQTLSPNVGGHLDSPFQKGHVITHHPKKGTKTQQNCVWGFFFSLSPTQSMRVDFGRNNLENNKLLFVNLTLNLKPLKPAVQLPKKMVLSYVFQECIGLSFPNLFTLLPPSYMAAKLSFSCAFRVFFVPGTPNPTSSLWLAINWMISTTSLHGKWLEITISIH